MTTRSPTLPPVFLLAGGPGSRRNIRDPLLEAVFAATGKPSPTIAYVGAASADNRAFLLMMTAFLKMSGAGRVLLAPMVSKRADMGKTRAILESADAILMSGGDVEAGMAVLERTGLMPLLRRLRGQGTVFFGLSAGSIMLAKAWVTWSDADDNASAQVISCMGIAPILCDTHDEEGGWSELKALLTLKREGTMGYGIPTGGGLRVTASGSVQAMGPPAHCYVGKGGKAVRIKDLKPPR